jgi:hypothetical protein
MNQLPLSENALKLTYGNAGFQNFSGRTPGPPLQGEGKGRRKEWKTEEGWKAKGWKGRAKGKGRKVEEEGERNLDPPPMFQTDRRH